MAENRDNYLIRKATAEDLASVRDMIQELADFEKMSDGPELSTADLIRDSGLDGGRDFMHCYVAECVHEETQSEKRELVGYAIAFFSYSTWQGKSYFLEDIYVKPSFRMRGVGQKIFMHVARMAKEHNCRRLDFHVLDWNPARHFYEKLGAVNLTGKEGWMFYRMNEEQISQMLHPQ